MVQRAFLNGAGSSYATACLAAKTLWAAGCTQGPAAVESGELDIPEESVFGKG
jgi:hypothetical protein